MLFKKLANLIRTLAINKAATSAVINLEGVSKKQTLFERARHCWHEEAVDRCGEYAMK